MSGKGSNRRPSEVPDEQLEDNWNRAFPKVMSSEEATDFTEFNNSIGFMIAKTIEDDYFANVASEQDRKRLMLGQGYESCKETDTERTEAAKSRGVERR